MTKMNFPQIRTINDLAPHVEGKREIRTMEQENGTVVVCYLVSSDSTFDNDHAKECRGITFDKDGNLICRPLHKFFNVNENADVQADRLRDKKIVRVMDKRDGSMITPTIVDGRLACKTKKSFESKEARHALAFINEHRNYLEFVTTMLEIGVTPIFEWTSKKSRIVIDYGAEDQLVLLHARDNVTGEYVRYEVLLDICSTPYHVPLVPSVVFEPGALTIDDFLELAQTTEDIEGWVIQFEDGDMVKIKTKWYLDLHHLVTFVRERDVANMVIEERLDDAKAAFIELGIGLDSIHAIEKRVTDLICNLRTTVEALVEPHKHLDRKTFAIENRDHELFGLMMTKFIGKEPDYVEHFRKYVLKDEFSLDQI